jgi:hypothetical protein
MENLKESNSLEMGVRYNKISNTILFFAENDSTFEKNSYFTSMDFKKDYSVAYAFGYYLSLSHKLVLNLKQFKIEISK